RCRRRLIRHEVGRLESDGGDNILKAATAVALHEHPSILAARDGQRRVPVFMRGTACVPSFAGFLRPGFRWKLRNEVFRGHCVCPLVEFLVVSIRLFDWRPDFSGWGADLFLGDGDSLFLLPAVALSFPE